MARKDDGILRSRLERVDSDFAEIVERIPPREEPQLPPYWLHLEIIERYKVLSYAKIGEGANVLEVGSGPHAIATVPLAYAVGVNGRVVAVERERWTYFEEVVEASNLEGRVFPLTCDAERLPFPVECFDLAVVVHGIRSLHSKEVIVKVLEEMFRVAPRIFVAESLPNAETKAQEAHLEMYNLRKEIFEAATGTLDDIHYIPMKELVKLVEEAGGGVIESKVVDIGQPHFLAFIPKEYVQRIEDEDRRENLLGRWEVAHEKLIRYGEEHPPVGIVRAERSNE